MQMGQAPEAHEHHEEVPGLRLHRDPRPGLPGVRRHRMTWLDWVRIGAVVVTGLFLLAAFWRTPPEDRYS